MSSFEILGAWISIGLTVMLLSFLYDDNPLYKFAEHVFLGVSIGIGITEEVFNTVIPHLYNPLRDLFAKGELENLAYLIVLVLVAFLFAKLDRKRAYLARIPISLMVAAFAGVKITGQAHSDLLQQVAGSMPDLRTDFAANLPVGTTTTLSTWQPGQGMVAAQVPGTCEGGWGNWVDGLFCLSNDGAGVISSLLLVLGLVCCLVYFYFGKHDRAILKVGSRVGVWVLMLGFGASFGFTVMGRISLAIGRGEELLGLSLTPEDYAQVKPRLVSSIFIALVVGALVLWRTKFNKPKEAT